MASPIELLKIVEILKSLSSSTKKIGKGGVEFKRLFEAEKAIQFYTKSPRNTSEIVATLQARIEQGEKVEDVCKNQPIDVLRGLYARYTSGRANVPSELQKFINDANELERTLYSNGFLLNRGVFSQESLFSQNLLNARRNLVQSAYDEALNFSAGRFLPVGSSPMLNARPPEFEALNFYQKKLKEYTELSEKLKGRENTPEYWEKMAELEEKKALLEGYQKGFSQKFPNKVWESVSSNKITPKQRLTVESAPRSTENLLNSICNARYTRQQDGLLTAMINGKEIKLSEEALNLMKTKQYTLGNLLKEGTYKTVIGGIEITTQGVKTVTKNFVTIGAATYVLCPPVRNYVNNKVNEVVVTPAKDAIKEGANNVANTLKDTLENPMNGLLSFGVALAGGFGGVALLSALLLNKKEKSGEKTGFFTIIKKGIAWVGGIAIGLLTFGQIGKLLGKGKDTEGVSAPEVPPETPSIPQGTANNNPILQGQNTQPPVNAEGIVREASRSNQSPTTAATKSTENPGASQG